MDYPMNADRYRLALKRFGLTQAQAAWLFNGKSQRSGRRWAADGAPFATALLLDLMEQYGIGVDDIEAIGARWRKDKAA